MKEDVVEVTLDRESDAGAPVGVDDDGRTIHVPDGEVGRTYRVVVIRTINGVYRGRIRAARHPEKGWGPVHGRSESTHESSG